MSTSVVTSVRHGKPRDELTMVRSRQGHSVLVEMDTERGGALVRR
jgi:hypothetical protein